MAGRHNHAAFYLAGLLAVVATAAVAQEGQRTFSSGYRFVEIYAESKDKERRLTVDYGRLHETEPVG